MTAYSPNLIRRGLTHPLLVFAVLAVFTTVAITGCSSNHAAGEYAPAVPVSRTFTHGQVLVFERSITVLQRSGYVLTVSDAAAGVITAERYSSLDQADRPQTVHREMTAGEKFLVFLSFVLVIGFIAMLFADSAKDDGSKSGSHEQKEKEHHHHDEPKEDAQPVSSFKYILTLRLKDSGERSTSVTASVTKVTISNGTPMQSAAVSSSVLTDGFFRLLNDELMFAP